MRRSANLIIVNGCRCQCSNASAQMAGRIATDGQTPSTKQCPCLAHRGNSAAGHSRVGTAQLTGHGCPTGCPPDGDGSGI